MDSLWTKTAACPQFGTLENDITTDILVIGGGMAGSLCTLMLRQAGADCVLAEAETIGSGITKDTTAKITVQHGLIYDRLIRTFGIGKAGQYLHANERALQMYRTLSKTVDCDFEEQDSFIYGVNPLPLEREVQALRELRANASYVTDLPQPIMGAGAVRLPKQAQFHPLKFLSQIVADLPVYEHTKVRELIGTTAVTEKGKIRANRIIVATHFPFLNKHGSYFLKLYQHRSYVLALQNVPQIKGMYRDADDNGLSFRMYGDTLLLGGGGHRTGKRGGWEELRQFAKAQFPDAIETAHWATQDCMTLDGVPYIGRYSKHAQDLYVAAGFNGWGMTSSMTAAIILCDLVQGRESPYAEIFSPSRSILHPQLAVNAAEAVVSMLTPTKKRCPHMGCALKWNAQEHSWDCPCHGSRFSESGDLIDNPAAGDLQ